jgi:hypothetical protein
MNEQYKAKYKRMFSDIAAELPVACFFPTAASLAFFAAHLEHIPEASRQNFADEVLPIAEEWLAENAVINKMTDEKERLAQLRSGVEKLLDKAVCAELDEIIGILAQRIATRYAKAISERKPK